MNKGQELPFWLSSGLRVPRAILGVIFLCAVLGLFSFRSDRELFSYIGVGATVLSVLGLVALITILAIRQRGIFVRNFFLGTISIFAVGCLWRWKRLAHTDAPNLWTNLLWLLVEAAIFATFWESMSLAFSPRARPRSQPITPASLRRLGTFYLLKKHDSVVVTMYLIVSLVIWNHCIISSLSSLTY